MNSLDQLLALHAIAVIVTSLSFVALLYALVALIYWGEDE